MIDHDELQRSMIRKLMDRIEDKTGIMIHEINGISDSVLKWEYNEITNSQIKETLSKYWDKINK